MSRDEREPGATFALDDICWIDFESKSKTSIKAGAYRYATEADAIVMAFAIGAAPAASLAVPCFNTTLYWSYLPSAIHRHYERVIRGEAIFAAWNAGFDKAIWNYATADFPYMEPHHIIDVMAQATASSLPPDLAGAARASGSTHKVEDGKKLIKLFCSPESTATPQSHPTEWHHFSREYAIGDIEAMRSVFLGTRQLPRAEWREYWATEAINERGVGIDLKMVEHAAELAAQDRYQSAHEIRSLTNGAVSTVDEVARLKLWLLDNMPPEARYNIMVEREEETDENGEITRKGKFGLDRRRVERLIALCKTRPGLETPERILQMRLYGGSKTPAKFAKIVTQHTDGILRGQYVFNGASQTGRASSKGVQIHNLSRDALPYELDAIDALTNGCSYDDLAAIGSDEPVARKLSLLIRPAFVPQSDKVFVWSDWSQIEARIVPWLADHYQGARNRLQIFRDVDADPSLPDLYVRSAADISHIPVSEVTKAIRQRGKVAELALGFCGGVGALQNMAAGYGLHLPDEEARQIVKSWRDANPWVMEYAKELWDAMLFARRAPGYYVKAGRIGFVFLREYLGGSLLCRLPSGRFLTYRALRDERVPVLNDDGEVIGSKMELTFSRAHGRVTMWHGILIENFTQAAAADMLRGTLVRLEDEGFATRIHTHDECLVEAPESEARATAAALREVMQRGFDWSDGLPLMSEETIAYHYSKNEKVYWRNETKIGAATVSGSYLHPSV